jgi:alpha-tubulin suppressor-like RCC1 family protein
VCWGFGQFGQLGDGGTTSRPLAAPVEGVEGALAVETGGRHTCAVVGGGSVRCWGANDRGQLGVDAGELATTPVELPLGGFVEVSAGEEHTCARNQAGPITCWGANDEGQLGDGTTEDRFEPLDAGVPEYAIAVSAGARHSCAVVQSGDVYCWGRNAELESGVEDPEPVLSPARVEGIEDAAEVCAGNGVTCARRNDGHVSCWGSGQFGMRGDGQTDGSVATPVEVLLVDDARDLAVGHNHTCAVRSGGEVWCWGRNQYGRLGDGTTTDRAEPTRVLDLAR